MVLETFFLTRVLQNCYCYFGATFEKIGLLFIPTSGRTDWPTFLLTYPRCNPSVSVYLLLAVPSTEADAGIGRESIIDIDKVSNPIRLKGQQGGDHPHPHHQRLTH